MSAINSSDQQGFNLGLPKGATGPGIQENNRLESQQKTDQSIRNYEQLQDNGRVYDRHFFDPVSDYVQRDAVYLIPTS